MTGVQRVLFRSNGVQIRLTPLKMETSNYKNSEIFKIYLREKRHALDIGVYTKKSNDATLGFCRLSIFYIRSTNQTNLSALLAF